MLPVVLASSILFFLPFTDQLGGQTGKKPLHHE
jgi:hypothetical protein